MKNQLPAKGAKKDSSKPAEPKRGGRKPKRGAKKLGGISSLGDNPNLLRGALIGVAILVLALGFGWWRGWFSRGRTVELGMPAAGVPATDADGEVMLTPAVTPAGTPQPQPTPQAQPTPPPQPKPQPTPQATRQTRSMREAEAQPTPQPGPPAVAEKAPPSQPKTVQAAKGAEQALPDDVAKWKKEDYDRARQGNVALLLKVVEYLGQKARESEMAAQGLTTLLKRPPDESPPHNPADQSKLVEAIVAALANNGSETSGKTLEEVLEGRFPTDDDRVAVEATLRALAAHPSPQNDALLLRAMTAAEALRPADRQGSWPARELRSKALESLKSPLSSEFRTKLAEAVAPRFEKFDAHDPIRDFFNAADPLSCGAQIVIYANANTSRETRSRFDQQFAGFSTIALSRLMGLVDEAPPGSLAPPAAKPSDVDAENQLAALLWSERFRAVFDPQVEDSRSWDKQPQIVLLASAMPVDSTRAALCKALRKHWSDGPKSLEAAGWIDRVTDPALLILLKMNPRKEAKSTAGSSASAGSASSGGKLEAAKQAAQKKAQAEQDWMAASSKLLTTWCRRLYATVAARDKAAAEGGLPIDDARSKLPGDIELEPGAKVTAAYHLLWPSDVPAAMSLCKPSWLELYYVRAEETGRMKRATVFYGRQAKTKPSDARKIDRTVWFDSVHPAASESDRRRSLDVLISRTDEKPSEPGRGEASKSDAAKDRERDEEETDLVVEILSIEIKDPAAHE